MNVRVLMPSHHCLKGIKEKADTFGTLNFGIMEETVVRRLEPGFYTADELRACIDEINKVQAALDAARRTE